MSEPSTRLDTEREPHRRADEAARDLVPEPAPLAPGDVVPRFRGDLRVQRHGSLGLVDMVDPRSSKRFTLYEFEVTIARLLDGRRSAGEVVEHGTRLGIPIDLPGLYRFVRQMWHYGFLAPEASPEEDGSGERTWGERERWDEATRTLFETGMRLVRTGRPAAAASYFEAVLDSHPAHPEATQMLAVIAQGRSLEATMIGDVRERPDEAGGDGRASPAAAAIPRSARAHRRLALAAGALGTMGIVASSLLLILDARRGTQEAAPVEIAAAPPTLPTAPAPLPAAGLPPEPAHGGVRPGPVDARRRPAIAEIVSPAAGVVRWKAAPGAQVNTGEVIAEVHAAVSAGAHRAELARRVAQLEALAAKDPVYRDFLAKARREQQRASRAKGRRVAIAAPAAGVLARPDRGKARAGAREPIGRILDPAVWELDATIDGDAPAAGSSCEVWGDAPEERARCRIVRAAVSDVEPRRASLTAEVAAPDAPWLERDAPAQLRVAPAGAAPTVP